MQKASAAARAPSIFIATAIYVVEYNINVLPNFVAAWVVRSKAATVRYFWITHSCLI